MSARWLVYGSTYEPFFLLRHPFYKFKQIFFPAKIWCYIVPTHENIKTLSCTSINNYISYLYLCTQHRCQFYQSLCNHHDMRTCMMQASLHISVNNHRLRPNIHQYRSRWADLLLTGIHSGRNIWMSQLNFCTDMNSYLYHYYQNIRLRLRNFLTYRVIKK